MTYEQVQELINNMTDEEFENVLIVANERISDWDRPHPYVELAKSAMAAVVIGAAGPASGVADELDDVLDDLREVIDEFEEE